MQVLFLYANLEMSSMVPLGLASLSGYIKKHGHKTTVFDTTFYKMPSIESSIRFSVLVITR